MGQVFCLLFGTPRLVVQSQHLVAFRGSARELPTPSLRTAATEAIDARRGRGEHDGVAEAVATHGGRVAHPRVKERAGQLGLAGQATPFVDPSGLGRQEPQLHLFQLVQVRYLRRREVLFPMLYTLITSLTPSFRLIVLAHRRAEIDLLRDVHHLSLIYRLLVRNDRTDLERFEVFMAFGQG